MGEIAGERGGHADDAPGVESAEDRALTADTVHDASGERGAEAVDPGEGGSQQAQLQGAEVHFALQKREDGEDGLAVGIVEEGDTPEHGDDVPFVAGGHSGRLSAISYQLSARTV